ncbi:cwf18 pre-mRNA splicing factor-domain-containing protein [Lentinula lateritia]|uniref:Cwf18 pre-mRNA splicing factor-domain-containing protein n=1 Tax=Lentinula aff. lateritia TaxID=2804960 RepID=A0ACC1U1N4_9AGAR|nr:cwf18 pre-mRNA splicing factor-domain-containing protein [Lentinula aff. lateritia]KAJ3854620.1 cwf18 pre-mRNA splicing factor-domain-containing protein [Lentinula lateritia]
MSLAETSEARKARLQELKQRKEARYVDATCGIIKNRNFDPESRTLKKHTASEDVEMDTVEKNIDGLAQLVIAEDEEKRAEELNVFNIAPKRPNWDLKRETDKKLAKLERKTQEAIHTLIRRRLAAQKGESDDIVGAMRAQENAQNEEALSDEE